MFKQVSDIPTKDDNFAFKICSYDICKISVRNDFDASSKKTLILNELNSSLEVLQPGGSLV